MSNRSNNPLQADHCSSLISRVFQSSVLTVAKERQW